MPRTKLNYAQTACVKKAGLVMQQTGMLRPGARVGVAVSGGVDSFVLMQTLLIRRRIVPFSVELTALHVNPGFAPDNHAPLADWLAERGVASHLEVSDHGPRAHSEENRKNSACFYCSLLRRTRLFELCRDYGLTHLAFGHNADDLAATFFLNLLQTARVEGMSAREDFFSGRLTVIRPLLLVEKKTIKQAARAWGLPVFDNPCPSAGASQRSEVTAWLDRAARDWTGSRTAKTNIYNALRRWQLDLSKRDQ